MPAYRTPVRYKGSRGVCVRIVDVPVRGDYAPILRVIFSHGGEGRELLWGIPWGCSIYRRRFILLAAHPSLRPVARSSSSPCSLFPYAFPCVSFVVSLGVSSCVSFCAFRCRRVVRRAVLPVRPVVPLVVSFRTVSLCCSLVLVSFVVAVLPCVLVRLVPPWHFVSFVVSLVVSSCSSRFCHVILFSLIRGRLVSVFMSVPVFAPFRPARRSFLFVHRFRFLCLRRGAGRCVIGRRGLPFSSHPFHLVPTRYSLVADRNAGRMWIWGAVPCCSPLVPCLSCPHRFTHLIEYHRPHMSSSSHP